MNESVDPTLLATSGTSLASPRSVSLTVQAKNIDPTSQQVECSVHIENRQPHRLRLISLTPFTPPGAEIQRVSDTSRSTTIADRDDLYAALSGLINQFMYSNSHDFRVSTAEAFRKTVVDGLKMRGIARIYYHMIFKGVASTNRLVNSTSRVWQIEIKSLQSAERYYERFLENKEGEHQLIAQLFAAKMNEVRIIEDDLHSDSHFDEIASIEGGGDFSATYVYNCKRRFLNPKVYTFSFNCTYGNYDSTETNHLSTSITTAITPTPIVLNIFAMLSSILGAYLKVFIDLTKDNNGHHTSYQNFFYDTAIWQPDVLIASMITALFFYNIYDSTEMGRKINVGVGWRSALLIGGLSGLLNQKVVAALQGLLG